MRFLGALSIPFLAWQSHALAYSLVGGNIANAC